MIKLGKNIVSELDALNLPPLFESDDTAKQKEKWKYLVQEYEYGYYPQDKMTVSGTVDDEKSVLDGRAKFDSITLTLRGVKGDFLLPIKAFIPNVKAGERLGAFVHIGFGDMDENSDIPFDKLVERGYAVFSFNCAGVTEDKDEFESGIIPFLSDSEKIADRQVGKLMIWGFAASRVLDYALSLGCIDERRTAVVGHSRLGKTALAAGAFDERFAYVISNNSGCGGAGLNRGKEGERISNITDKFGYWFTRRFAEFAGKDDELPFDQHTLMAIVAPRCVYVCSASQDGWSDPKSEFLGAAALGEVYEKYDLDGLIAEDILGAGEHTYEGSVGYHMREGGHAMKSYDWEHFINFIDQHKNNC